MLDVTTNQNINCMSSSLASTSLDDDIDDQLFDNDWLHENNLDILFDLFEEEVEGKATLETSTNNSSTLFGSSPVSSYLFGTSPTLASALDLYDLLCFDNQQASPTNTNASQSTITSSTATYNVNSDLLTTTSSTNNAADNCFKSAQPPNCYDYYSSVNSKGASSSSSATSSSSSPSLSSSTDVTANHIANSISNAIRIQRRLRKGQNEGTSLLARPLSCNNGKGNSVGRSSCTNSPNNISDKTITKLTNFNRPPISNSRKSYVNINNNIGGGSIDTTKQLHNYANRNKQHLHHYHQHAYHITGRAVMLEHAYAAVRGH